MQKFILLRFPGPVRWTKSVLRFLYLLQSTFCVNGVIIQKRQEINRPSPMSAACSIYRRRFPVYAVFLCVQVCCIVVVWSSGVGGGLVPPSQWWMTIAGD